MVEIGDGLVAEYLREVHRVAQQTFGPRAKVIGAWDDEARRTGLLKLVVTVAPDLLAVKAAAVSEAGIRLRFATLDDLRQASSTLQAYSTLCRCVCGAYRQAGERCSLCESLEEQEEAT